MKTLLEKCPKIANSLTSESLEKAASISSYGIDEIDLICYICQSTTSIKAKSVTDCELFRCSSCRFITPNGDSFHDRAPHLINEWSDKNKVNLKNIWFLAKQKFFWNCNKAHEWKASADQRFNGRECPECFGRKQVFRDESLAALFPEIAAEWSPNNERPAHVVSPGSQFQAIWRCSKNENHAEWQTSVVARTPPGPTACPECSNNTFVSKGELSVVEFLKSSDIIGTTSNRSLIAPYELDFVSSDNKHALEFNGDYYHSDNVLFNAHGLNANDFHQRKLNLAKDAGVDLIFVWESDWYDRTDDLKKEILEFFNDGIISASLRKLTSPIDDKKITNTALIENIS